MNINDYIKKKAGKSGGQKPRSMDEAMNTYSRMNEEQLMQEMFRAAREGKETGELTDEKLESFYQQARAFLSPEQAERMRELIIELKK